MTETDVGRSEGSSHPTAGEGLLSKKRGHHLLNNRWSNWAGNQRCRPIDCLSVAFESQIVEAVSRARASRVKLKAVGSGHSFTDIACTQGAMLETSGLAGVIDHSHNPPRASIAAGTTIEVAAETLWGIGLSFSSLGDIGKQTLAGAIATGTHGTSSIHGSISSQVRRVRLVDGLGNVREIGPDSHPEMLDAVRVNLGALGIVTELEFDLEPAYFLETNEWPMPLEEARENLLELFQSHRHFEFFWFPHTKVALAKSHDLTSKRPRPASPTKVWFYTVFLGNYFFEALCKVGKIFPPAIPSINRFIASRETPSRRVAPAHRAFINERRVRFYEMEYAVPAEAAPDLLSRLERAIESSGLRISFPVEVRYSPSESAWLSPAFGRETVWVAIHTYRGVNPRKYFEIFEALAAEVSGRPHWGKMHFLDARRLARLYPRWKDFQEVRRMLDPERIFANRYLEQVLGSE